MTDGLRVLIADDERPAREKLRRFLEASPKVTTIFEARSGSKALDVVRDEQPDVIFLDIKMPGIDGLAAAQAMAGRGSPHIVFVTAYDEHAIRAFELGAADYLLKPFDRDRFNAALDRVVVAIETEQIASDAQLLRDTLRNLASPLPMPERLIVDDDGRSRVVPLRDIIKCEAQKNHVEIWTEDGSFRLRTSMTGLEGRLPSGKFARINRSQIVNLEWVLDLTAAGHGDMTLRLRDGSTMRLSRRYRHRVQDWL